MRHDFKVLAFEDIVAISQPYAAFPVGEQGPHRVVQSKLPGHGGGGEGRAGQETIYPRAERDLEKLIHHDSDTTTGSDRDRRQQITGNCHSAMAAAASVTPC
ncbi:hypothetical protein D3C84_985060 [compost metagenome]